MLWNAVVLEIKEIIAEIYGVDKYAY